MLDITSRINNKTAILLDQEVVLALNDPWHAFLFAYDVPGADIERCQTVACVDLFYAFYFAYKDSEWECWFSKHIPT